MMGYSLTDSAENCYPGTTVLINKLNIRSQEALDDVERVLVGLHTIELEREPPAEPFSFPFYLDLHRKLFGDLYEWAGELRTVDISKKGTVFCVAKNLEEIGNAIFDELKKMNELRGLRRDKLVKEAAKLYHRLNLLHPFREGNGRTQRLFFSLLIRRTGFEINFAECDTELLMIATIYAAQGVMDQLYAFFDQAIR